MANDAPTWLNAAFIEEALAAEASANMAKHPPRVEVLALSKATAPGENYSSAMFRARATLATGEARSLLVKVPPQDEAMARAVTQGGLFTYETAMLVKHIPAMEAYLEKASPGKFPPFAARCLLHGTSPVPFLVVEDLKPQGFRLAERRSGLDLSHCLMALRSLARFHAASAALLTADPSVTNDFTNILRKNAPLYDSLVRSFFQLPGEACTRWPGYEEYGVALKKFAPKSMLTMADLHDPRPGKFNVLLHGDYWTNNIMFKYEDGELKDIRMVDLQISHVASPAIDLLYFLTTSPSDEVFENHESLLLREYHSELAETMELLGHAPPTLQDLLADIDAHGLYAYFGALGVWPIARSVGESDVNSRLAGDADGPSNSYEEPHVKRYLQRILPEFKRRGWMKF